MWIWIRHEEAGKIWLWYLNVLFTQIHYSQEASPSQKCPTFKFLNEKLVIIILYMEGLTFKKLQRKKSVLLFSASLYAWRGCSVSPPLESAFYNFYLILSLKAPNKHQWKVYQSLDLFWLCGTPFLALFILNIASFFSHSILYIALSSEGVHAQ